MRFSGMKRMVAGAGSDGRGVGGRRRRLDADASAGGSGELISAVEGEGDGRSRVGRRKNVRDDLKKLNRMQWLGSSAQKARDCRKV